MPVYTVHEPPLKGGEGRAAPERFRFVRDGFHFWAFLLGPLWMIWRRLWVVLIGYIVVCVVTSFAMFALGVPASAAAFVQLLISFFVGLEAGSLQRWSLRRWREVGIVSGDNREAAERRFFDGWERDEPAAAPAAAVTPVPPEIRHRAPQPSDIIGVFPEPGMPR
ncbi:MAG: DUF2628 domain-containing protein [Variibacter sp.]